MRIASNKIKDVISFFQSELKGIYSDDEIAVMTAWCFEEFLGIKRHELKLAEEGNMSESELLKFNFAVKDLKNERPIQYIFGKADFFGMKLKVNEHVLIPRPETEELVQLIIKDGANAKSILDIGTGSGCIAIALKKNIPGAEVTAIDISKEALEVALYNADKQNAEIHFLREDILSPSAVPFDQYDIIVSNPPYIRLSEKESMQKNVTDHEPHLALFVDDPDPLLFYKAIADHGLKALKKDGQLYFEINEALGAEAKLLLENKGFKNVTLIKDINNKNRILRGTR